MRRALVLVSFVALVGCKESSSSGPAPQSSASAAPAPSVAIKKASSAASLAGLDVRGLTLSGSAIVVAGTRGDAVVVEKVDGSTIAELGSFAATKPVVSGVSGDADGVLLGGAFADSLQAGTTKLAAAGAVDGFLVRLGTNGKVAWAKDLRAPKPKAPADVGALAIAKDGSSFVEGSSLGAALSTDDPERGTGLEAIYRLDRDGRPKWKKRYDGDVNVRSVALDGDVAWAVGTFGGDLSFGGEKAKSLRARSADKLGTTFGTDFFVARVDGSGKTTFLRSFGSTTSRAITIALAPDGKGGAAVAGEHEGVVDFGTGPNGAAGAVRLFVAKLDPAGKTAFARSIEIPKTAHLTSVAADAGSVVVTGDFSGELDPGGTKLTSAGGSDCFLARYDGDGKLVDAFRFGGSGDDKGGLVVLRDDGSAVVSGVLAGRADLGTGEIGKPGDLSAFVATFSK